MHPIAQHHQASSSPPSASAQATHGQPARLIRLPAVEALTGLKRSSIYAGMRAGTFPGSVRLSIRAVAWRESEVLAWCAERAKTGGADV
ncbi:MAG TPA: AlpA family transcriptional regulator [Acidovorax sp.]|jgi:prophage regulatory protein|nr:AlpA family transcriptional regulator [Acidovorax sp.]